MSGQLFDKYGAILAEDVVVLEACLRELLHDCWDRIGGLRPIRVIEVGMHDGGTARGIERFLNERGASLDYTGIDPDDGKTRPRYLPAGGRAIIGDSAEVFHLAPRDADLVWVDGCHCINHVILDTVHYGERVRPGGFMLFHDVNPAGQGRDHQYHGPDIPEFGLAISAAHAAVRFPWEGWSMVLENWPADAHNCGTRAFRKSAP